MNSNNIKPKIKNVHLIAADNQFYKLYLTRYKPDQTIVRSKVVVPKSQTMSYVLEIVVREWIKSSKIASNDRIISFEEHYNGGRHKVIYKELDYILKQGTHYTVGELKVSAKGLLTKAAEQLTFSKELLSSNGNKVDTQIVWVDLNYKNSVEPIDEFNPTFLKSKFRTVEINNQKFKLLRLSADDIFKWGVEQKIIQTPELIQVAMIEAELLHQQRQIKAELKQTKKQLEENTNEQEREILIQQLRKLEHDLSLISVKVHLSQQGWVHLTDKTEEFLKEVIEQLGKTIYVADVIIKPDSKTLVTSARALDFHTDHHKAKYIAWHCIRQTDKGGETILMDAEKVYHRLSAEDRKELESIELFEHKVFPDDSESNPLVNSNGLRKFYYSFWLVKKEQKENSALREFQRYIKESEPISLLLKPNDILLIDNHRILHGRNAIEGSKDRYLKRFWISN